MFVFWQEVASPQERLTQLRIPGPRPVPGLAASVLCVFLRLAGGPGPVAPLAPPAVRGEGVRVLLRTSGPGHGGLVRGRLTCGRGWRDNSAACPPV